MRIEDLKRKHNRETTYIIGPGASILDYSDKFWKELSHHTTISIADVPLYLFFMTSYWLGIDRCDWVYGAVDSIASKHPDRGIFLYPYELKNVNWIEFHNFSGSDLIDFLDKPPSEQDGLTTNSSLSGAISLAAYMGASNIHLVGIDCGFYKGKWYWNGRMGSQGTLRGRTAAEKQTIYLNEAKMKLIKHGISLEKLMPEKEVINGKIQTK